MGTRAERELLHRFWNTGKWVVLRAPSSGAIKYPCPDLLAGNRERKLAIECKSTGSNKQYFTGKEVEELCGFSKIFGAEPWVAVRFAAGNKSQKGTHKPEWYFFNIEDLSETTGGNFVVSVDIAKRKGLLFEELVG